MTIYAVHTTTTGTLASIGTVIADPLPTGLTATALNPGDGQALRDGTGTWDAATRTVVAVTPDPAEANRATIEGRAATLITQMDAITATTDTLTAAQLSGAVRQIAAGLRGITRLTVNLLDSAD